MTQKSISRTPDTIELWPDGVPDAIGRDPGDIPTLTLYRPPQRESSSAIIVCPGGGYGGLADHEGGPIANWLNTLGITGVVLKYRHAPRYRHPSPLMDAAQAIRTVRARAGEWKIDPARVGILGFSAGGHLAATISTQFEEGDASSPHPFERIGSRPDLSILLYAVITFIGNAVHEGSRVNLLGERPSADVCESLSAERRVSLRTPPAFLFHTVDDEAVPVENSIAYAMALRAASVPFEMHLFEKGPHGVGLGAAHPDLSSWPALCATWLRSKGFGSQL